MQEKDIEELLNKYHAGNCSPEEVAFLESWYAQWNEKIPVKLSPEELAEDLQIISSNVKPLNGTARQIRLWPRIAAAASVLLILSIGGYFILHKQSSPQIAQNQAHDIAPGSNKAILITHGKQISITDAKNGLLAQQGNTSITKTDNGTLVYNNSAGSNEVLVYDTLITPRGGQHELELADGSKLLLNADTKIRYPERFARNERRIELISGEAIFHVKHNANIPFYITVKGQTVKDLGTDFDINAYDDEPVIKTTLVEGSVEVIKGAQSKLLKPGQQAVVHDNEPILIQTANIDQVMAWQNGKFYFEKTGLRELMRQVSRWYNIDVVYEGSVSDDGYTGQPSRKVNLSQMLKILEYGDVHFKIEPGKGKGAGKLIITQ